MHAQLAVHARDSWVSTVLASRTALRRSPCSSARRRRVRRRGLRWGSARRRRGAARDPRQLGARLGAQSSRRAARSVRRPSERLARGGAFAWPGAAASQCEQRPRAVRRASAPVRARRVRAQGAACRVWPCGGGEQPAAAVRRRERGLAVQPRPRPPRATPAPPRVIGRGRARSTPRSRRGGRERGRARGRRRRAGVGAVLPGRSAISRGRPSERSRNSASAHCAWTLATAIARSPASASAPSASARASSTPTLRGPDQRPDCEPERLLVTLPGLERDLVPFVGEPRGLRPLPVVVRGHCRLGGVGGSDAWSPWQLAWRRGVASADPPPSRQWPRTGQWPRGSQQSRSRRAASPTAFGLAVRALVGAAQGRVEEARADAGGGAGAGRRPRDGGGEGPRAMGARDARPLARPACGGNRRSPGRTARRPARRRRPRSRASFPSWPTRPKRRSCSKCSDHAEAVLGWLEERGRALKRASARRPAARAPRRARGEVRRRRVRARARRDQRSPAPFRERLVHCSYCGDAAAPGQAALRRARHSDGRS